MAKSKKTAKRNYLTVAVISDVHAYEGVEPDKAPSHCCITDNDAAMNPIAGLKAIIRRESDLVADLLLCPGDIGDKAQPAAIQHTWKELHEIRRLLKAEKLIATTGNHDIDSRYAYTGYDAKGMLQSLEPKYPFANEQTNDRYWSRHFVVATGSQYRVLVLNSSAFHGEGRIGENHQPEYEQGRVSQHTLRMIQRELDRVKPAAVNILLCHHHPHSHSELRLGEKDLMIGGRELLDLIGSGRYGRWFVLHGHKHHPKIEYAAGGAAPPIVFAAGSCAAVLFRELQTACRNQFYLVTFPYTVFPEFGFVGRFRSWDWLSGQGWVAASKGSGLPSHGGFGWRGDVALLARQVSSAVRRNSVPWSELVSRNPQLAFLLPQDLEELVHHLEQEHGLLGEPHGDVPPVLIGRAI